jgi:hypothetical protein
MTTSQILRQETTTMTTNQPTAPFPELADQGSTDVYDLTAFLTVNVARPPSGAGTDPSNETREYCIESGRTRGAWHLRVSPWSGSMTDDDVLTGPPMVDLRGQTAGSDPLALLRALLTGGGA